MFSTRAAVVVTVSTRKSAMPRSWTCRRCGFALVFRDTALRKGFQIYITPYTGSEISQVELLEDNPSGVMKQITNITIDNVPATMFFSYDKTLGDTREVWFIRGDYLFEATTYEADDQWLAGIMSTWLWLPTSASSTSAD
jgi:hypothetical protein